METTNQLKIQVSETFDTPVEKLFAAWTEPAQLKQWWKPMDNQLTDVTNELNDGGNIDYQFEGNKLHIYGQYSSVKPNELLAYSWNWELPSDQVKNSAYQLTIEFHAKDNGSAISITQDAFETEESMLPHEEGWKKGLQQLKDYLAQHY